MAPPAPHANRVPGAPATDLQPPGAAPDESARRSAEQMIASCECELRRLRGDLRRLNEEPPRAREPESFILDGGLRNRSYRKALLGL